MPSLRSRLFIFALKNRYLLKGQLRRRTNVDWSTSIDQLREERRRVREQNELLDRLVEVSPGGIVLCDFDGNIPDLNPPAIQLWGGLSREALVGRPPKAFDNRLGRGLDAIPAGGSRIVTLQGGRRIKAHRAAFHLVAHRLLTAVQYI